MDICPRGAGAYTDYPLNSNEKVNIIIKPSALIDTFIYKQAKVAWCNKVSQNLWGVGFDFGEDNKITFAWHLFIKADITLPLTLHRVVFKNSRQISPVFMFLAPNSTSYFLRGWYN